MGEKSVQSISSWGIGHLSKFIISKCQSTYAGSRWSSLKSCVRCHPPSFLNDIGSFSWGCQRLWEVGEEGSPHHLGLQYSALNIRTNHDYPFCPFFDLKSNNNKKKSRKAIFKETWAEETIPSNHHKRSCAFLFIFNHRSIYIYIYLLVLTHPPWSCLYIKIKEAPDNTTATVYTNGRVRLGCIGARIL